MSTRLSPDSMYYWDGERWLTTLSPDGRFRWDGVEWRPVSRAADAAGYYPARIPTRVPTSWTRPLQYGVSAWYLFSGLYAFSLPFWMSGPMTDSMNQSFQRQAQADPNAIPPSPEFTATIVTFVVWFLVVFLLAFSTVAILGAIRRWTWTYYVVLIFLGLGVLYLPVTLINIATHGSVTAASGYNTPSWVLWIAAITSVPAGALFVFMLVAVIKRGPWAMTPPDETRAFL